MMRVKKVHAVYAALGMIMLSLLVASVFDSPFAGHEPLEPDADRGGGASGRSTNLTGLTSDEERYIADHSEHGEPPSAPQLTGVIISQREWTLYVEDTRANALGLLRVEVRSADSILQIRTSEEGSVDLQSSIAPGQVAIAKTEGRMILGFCESESDPNGVVAIACKVGSLSAQVVGEDPQTGSLAPLKGAHVEVVGRVSDFYGSRHPIGTSLDDLGVTTRSADDGSFTIARCPHDPEFRLKIWSTEYGPSYFPWDAVSGKTVVLPRRTDLIAAHGRVVDSEGRGISSAHVRILERVVAVDENGEYSVWVPAHSFPLHVYGRDVDSGIGVLIAEMPEEESLALPNLVLLTTSALSGVVEFPGGSSPLSGVFAFVHSRDSLDGERLPEARSLGRPLLVANCDEKGRFEFPRLLPGVTRVFVVDPRTWSSAELIVSVPSTDLHLVQMTDMLELVDVAGVCRASEDGQPVQERLVVLFPKNSLLRRYEVQKRLTKYEAETDGNGEFLIAGAPCELSELLVSGSPGAKPLDCTSATGLYEVGEFRTLELVDTGSTLATMIRVLDSLGNSVPLVFHTPEGTTHFTHELTRSENGWFPMSRLPSSGEVLSLYLDEQQIGVRALPQKGSTVRIQL